jgi:hypothetical protein
VQFMGFRSLPDEISANEHGFPLRKPPSYSNPKIHRRL